MLGTVLGTAFGLVMGYFRGFVDETLCRIVDAFLAIPLIVLAILVITALGPSSWTVIVVIGFVFAPIIARTVRAAVLTSASWTTCPRRGCAARSAAHHVRRDPARTCCRRSWSSSRCGSATRSSRSRRCRSSASASSRPSPDWGLQIAENYGLIGGGFWWPMLFPRAGDRVAGGRRQSRSPTAIQAVVDR